MHSLFFFLHRRPPRPPLFPYTTLFRSSARERPPPMRRIRPRLTFCSSSCSRPRATVCTSRSRNSARSLSPPCPSRKDRSEEHTSELQSHHDLVCRLLLEKKKQKNNNTT